MLDDGREQPDSMEDERLVETALQGDRLALEALLRRHQRWLFNLALRMLSSRADAEDATQEVLVKIATRLSSFRGESGFRTWAYRIAANHLLDCKRSAPEKAVHGFDCYGAYLESAPDLELSERESSPETRLLIEEARLGCTIGMLLCLDREQRLVFVLGEIFDLGDAVGSEVLGLSRDNFRQKLCRSREQLSSFLNGRCGLVDPANPCRCARKTRAFIRDGIVDPANLQFASDHVARVREIARESVGQLGARSDSGALALFRDHPYFAAPDLVMRIGAALGCDVLRTAQQVAERSRQ